MRIALRCGIKLRNCREDSQCFILPPKIYYRGDPLDLSQLSIDLPDDDSLLFAALRGCSCSRDLETGLRVHSHLATPPPHFSLHISTTLVSMYAKCGSLLNAALVFNRMPCHSVVSWNALIQGSIDNHHSELALQLFSRMETEGCPPDAQTFTAAAMAAASLAEKEEGKLVQGKLVKLNSLARVMRIHSQAVSCGCDDHLFLASTLVGMYSKCGSLTDARIVFDRVAFPDVVLWTALMIACTDNGEPELALQLFSRLKRCVVPDEQTFLAALMACVALAEKEEGRAFEKKVVKLKSLENALEVHAQAASRGYESNIFLAVTLVDLYSKSGSLVNARKVFERTPFHNVVLWNALILGYVDNGEEELALELFSRMNHAPDDRTYIAALMACAGLATKEQGKQMNDKLVKIQSLEKGMILHSEAAERGYEGDPFVASSLVDMYARCGSLFDARIVFDMTRQRDVVLWNALLMGYAENGEPDLALQLFCLMQSKNARTFVAAIVACGSLVDLETGRRIHEEICGRGFDKDVYVANCLVVFYGKCGSMSDAQKVFDSMSRKNLVAWNALMTGYSRQGNSQEVFHLFERMRGSLQADGITYLAVLTACSHSGLVDKGKEFFAMMRKGGVEAEIEHYHCVIDLLGRANLLEEAVEVVKGMPYEASSVTWNTVLAGSRKWNNVKVGRVAFDSLMRMDVKQATSFVLMANIYRTEQIV